MSVARTFSGTDIDGPGPARATDGPGQAGQHHAGFKSAGCRRIFTCLYGLKRHRDHYKLRNTKCASSSGFELINTFRRDLATGLNKEIPMLPPGTAHIQVVCS